MDFSTRESGIAQGNSVENAVNSENRWAAFGQRALQALMALAGERYPGVRASMRRRQNLGWKFRPERAWPTRWASISREARGGVLERTLGRGSRAWRASEGGDHRALRRLISFQCSALAL